MTVIPGQSEQKRLRPAAPPLQQERKRNAAAPVLVTEQQVLLSTAAAGAGPAPTPARGLTDAFRGAVAALHGIFAAPTTQIRPGRRVVPPRSRSYYESSLMSRELFRL